MVGRYNVRQTEEKWQKAWSQDKCFRAEETSSKSPTYYVLEMFPCLSGKLHVGHVRNYLLEDVISRYHWALGFNVLHAMGWDAFGLPAENAAFQRKIHPRTWKYQNAAEMAEELKALGLSYDWEREIFFLRAGILWFGTKNMLGFLQTGSGLSQELFCELGSSGANGFSQ